nr:SpaA isopeptide-forming pilin-related protein [uncultured Blautia sp.]
MKKMRKIFAVLLTLAMVLGMSMTTFAAKVTNQYTDKITVTNLAADVDTTLNLYNIIYLDQDDAGNQTWKVVDWAKNFVSEVTADGEFKIIDADGLRNAADADTTVADDTVTEPGTSHVFTGLPIGAYVIRAFDEKGTYSLMVANTYNKDGETYMASKSANVVAKMSGYNVKKEAEDKFVHRGQRVNFTVTTQMASKTNAEGKNLETFKVIDTSKGLKEDSFILESVVIAGDEKKNDVDASKISVSTNDKGEVVYTVDLSGFINGTEAGATIVVKYSAIVEDDHKYNNSATVNSDTVQYGGGTVDGFMGNVTLRKVDTNGNVLNGAEFQLLKVTPAKEDGTEATKTPVNVVKVSAGEYKVALEGEEGVTTTLVATNGTLKVTGLDEGNYEFKETKAPVGYKVNSENKAFTITANEKAEVTVDAGNFVNTKLSALPSTGGIGTTIFTIAGCAIMVAAAGLFFASRKRTSK